RLGMVARIVCGQPGGPAEQGEIPNKGQVATGTVPDSQTIVDQGSLSYPYQPSGNGGGDGGEEGAETLEEMGVPYQAHFVGLAALFGVFVSLIYSFYFLKYAESPQHKDQRDR
ncbi:MAG: hypothetical protein SV377_05625, partial [Halobacteria archaeon]|nr:hypothetical protein [Halobacteria archaeon]